ncbi:hypothetical protein RhiirA4_484861 [Rhizophagus irregularis]|uniref:Uncharacterized protein n=1 Tax=Rhizophagus irregularis TaxID=588596 RepID=A0A2I1HPE9_9GLOM|nr:hypothetical protein RhiirA4_478871 [Rhizophagus irregularis]PKY60765.1 hypothetical protein RhiirA4_484861 [Rhizophagus irregularis]
MAGFSTDPNNNEFPIPFYDKNIEPLLFPPYGKGFYLRNHQNRTKILNQHSTFLLYQLTAADFITNNIYTECPIINETKTTIVASYIRTGVSYFCQKEHHINTMVQGFGLPQISSKNSPLIRSTSGFKKFIMNLNQYHSARNIWLEIANTIK